VTIDALARALAPRIAADVAKLLESRSEIMFAPAVAKAFNKTPDGFRMWLTRGPGKPFAELKIDGGAGQKAWRRSDVEAFLDRGMK